MNKNIQELHEIMEGFNKKFSVYKCENKQDSIYYSILISCISGMILSKKFFKKNKDLLEFLQKHFGINFPEYVAKNRALILGRTIKHFSEIESISEIKDYLNKLYMFIDKVLQEGNDKDVFTWQDAIDIINLR